MKDITDVVTVQLLGLVYRRKSGLLLSFHNHKFVSYIVDTSSGALCANSIMSVWEQLELNSKIKMPIQYGRGPVAMTSPQPEKVEESMFAPLTSLRRVS